MAQVKDLLVKGQAKFLRKAYFQDQIVSNVAQGTAPLVVASSTVVSNLNSDYLDGYHASGLFTALSANSTLSITIGGTTLTSSINAATVDGKYISNYYTKSEADDRFVNVAGDTMSGPLHMPSGTAITNGSSQNGNYMLAWDGSTIIGSYQGASYVRSSGDNLYHRVGANTDYKILDANNYSSYIPARTINIDGTNYTVYSPYTTQITVDTTRVTQTITDSNYTNKRPILVGASNNGSVTPTFSTTTDGVLATHRIFVQPSTGNLYLYNPDRGDSPFLYFQRGDLNTENTYDWRMFVSSGNFYLQLDEGGWRNALSITYDNIATFAGNVHATIFVGNLSGNASSASVASSVVCSAGTSNIDRPILVTNESNGILYTDKAKLNYSTGRINCGGVTFTDNTGGSSFIRYASNNVDTKIFRVYSADTTYAESANFGFDLTYTGSGSGNENKLILRADNQASSQVNVFTAYQDGNITFSKTPKVGSTSVSLSNHGHDGSYVKVLGAGSYNPLGAYVRPIYVDGSGYDFLSPYSTNSISITTTNVYQSDTNTTNYRGVILGYTSQATVTSVLSNGVTAQVYLTPNIIAQSSTGTLAAKVYKLLHPTSIGEVRCSFTYNNYGSYGWGAILAADPNGPNIVFKPEINGQVYIDGNSKIIGVLNVNGTSDYSEGIRIHGSSSIASLWLRATNDTGYQAKMWGISADDNGMRFRGPASTSATSPNDYMNILHGGNVGINNTSPSWKLTVDGDIALHSSSGDSPTLRWIRGTTSDGLNDWRMYVSDGVMYLDMSTFGTFTNMLQLTTGIGTAYLGGTNLIYHSGNLSRSTLGIYDRTLNINGNTYTLSSPYSTQIDITYSALGLGIRTIIAGGSSYNVASDYFATNINLDNVYLKLSNTSRATVNFTVNSHSEMLHINRVSGGSYSCIAYDNGGTLYGCLGFTGTNTPSFISTDSTPYTLYHSGNLSRSTLGIYDRNISIDGQTYMFCSPYTGTATITTTNVTQTVSTSGNTDFRPILVSGVTSTSSVTPSFSTGTGTVLSAVRLYMQPSTGNLYLYNPDGGDSPHLVFQRAGQNDGTYDWDQYVSGGTFYLRYNAGSWVNVLSMYPAGVTSAWQITAPAFYESSDERLKDFYNAVDVDLDKLSSLPKKFFKWKSNPNGEFEIGTSAQELQKIYPQLVNTDDKGYLTVAYDKLSIIALRAIDKLYEMNKNLERRIQILESKH